MHVKVIVFVRKIRHIGLGVACYYYRLLSNVNNDRFSCQFCCTTKSTKSLQQAACTQIEVGGVGLKLMRRDRWNATATVF